MTSNLALVAVGGLLVGFGSRMGNGCTSGHGVCGFARLSVRSIVGDGDFHGGGGHHGGGRSPRLRRLAPCHSLPPALAVG